MLTPAHAFGHGGTTLVLAIVVGIAMIAFIRSVEKE